MTRPGAAYADELLRVVAPEDGGESPFGWSKPQEPTRSADATPDAPQGPETALRPARGRTARFLTPRRTK